MPIYAVECGWEGLTHPLPPSPGASWSIQPVVFNNAALICNLAAASSLIGLTANIFSFAGWYKTAWEVGTTGSEYAWAVDPQNTQPAWLAGFGSGFSVDSSNSPALDIDFSDTDGDFADTQVGPYTTAWMHIIGTLDTNPSADFSTIATYTVYINDISVSAMANSGAGGPTMDAAFAAIGLPFWVGSDSFGDDFVGEMADVSIWAGVDFRDNTGDIPTATRRLFIDASKNPVNPTAAINQFGSPSILLTGNAATFASNTFGTSGPLHLEQGALTDGAYPPGTKTPGYVSHSAKTTNLTFPNGPNLPANFSSGDLLIALIAYASTPGDVITMDHHGSPPWNLGEYFQDSNNGIYAWMWTIADAHTQRPMFHSSQNPDGNGATATSIIAVFDGVNQAHPIGSFGHTLGTGTSFNQSGISTSSPYSLVFGVLYQNQSGNAMSSFTTSFAPAVNFSGSGFFWYYQIVPAAGHSDDFEGVLPTAANWRTFLIEIQAAG